MLATANLPHYYLLPFFIFMQNLNIENFYEKLNNCEEGRQYICLVENAQKENRGIKKEKGFEIHHIHPRKLGGDDSEANKVKLTNYEHSLAHLLIAKAFPCNETLNAIKIMGIYKTFNNLSKEEKETIEDLYYFSSIREESLRTGHPCSENTKRKISQCNKWKKYAKGLKRSENMRKILRELAEKHYAEKSGPYSKESQIKNLKSNLIRQKNTYGKIGGQFHTKEAEAKSQQTRTEKYGSPTAMLHTDEAHKKSIETKIKIYGSAAGRCNSKEVRDKEYNNRLRKMSITHSKDFLNWYDAEKYGHYKFRAVNDYLEKIGKKLEDFPPFTKKK